MCRSTRPVTHVSTCMLPFWTNSARKVSAQRGALMRAANQTKFVEIQFKFRNASDLVFFLWRLHPYWQTVPGDFSAFAPTPQSGNSSRASKLRNPMCQVQPKLRRGKSAQSLTTARRCFAECRNSEAARQISAVQRDPGNANETPIKSLSVPDRKIC